MKDMKKMRLIPTRESSKDGVLVGILTGLTAFQAGRKPVEFIHDVNVLGIEHPKGPWGWDCWGSVWNLKGHSSTFENWWKGKYIMILQSQCASLFGDPTAKGWRLRT